MVASERSTVPLADRFNDYPGLAELVDVTAPAWPRMVDWRAAVVVGGCNCCKAHAARAREGLPPGRRRQCGFSA